MEKEMSSQKGTSVEGEYVPLTDEQPSPKKKSKIFFILGGILILIAFIALVLSLLFASAQEPLKSMDLPTSQPVSETEISDKMAEVQQKNAEIQKKVDAAQKEQQAKDKEVKKKVKEIEKEVEAAKDSMNSPQENQKKISEIQEEVESQKETIKEAQDSMDDTLDSLEDTSQESTKSLLFD